MPLPAISEKLSEDLNLKNISLCYRSISKPILLKHPKVKNNMTHQIMDDKDPAIPGPSTNMNYTCNYGKCGSNHTYLIQPQNVYSQTEHGDSKLPGWTIAMNVA